MKNILWALIGMLIFGVPAVAQEGDAKNKQDESAKAAPQEDTADQEVDLDDLTEEQAAELVKELTEGFEKSMAEFRERFMAASEEERNELRSQAPSVPKTAEKLQAIADKFPGKEFAGDALIWVASRQRGGPAFDQALDSLLANHISHPGLSGIVMALGSQRPSPAAEERFQMILENEEVSDQVSGITRYAYLQYQKSVGQIKEAIGSDEERAAAIERAYGEETFAYVKNYEVLGSEAYLTELEGLVEDYGEIEIFPGRTLASVAEGEIFEARYLQVGLVAPDIEGEDIDGVEFKLSDYRGKVVVLDFWGDW